VQQSNGYIIGFAFALTIILGGLLSGAAVSLKPAQKEAIALDTRKQILSAVMETKGVDKRELSKEYDKKVKSMVVEFEGKVVEGEVAEKVDIRKEYKKKPEARLYPVFMYSEAGTDKVDAYILPTYGLGLWDNIWGFLAVKPDLNTVAGYSMDHKGETPGLGARITDASVQNRYKGQKLFNDNGDLVSVSMIKGEGNPNLDQHTIDGMSGATITGDGVNKMLENYVGYYKNYFAKLRKAS